MNVLLPNKPHRLLRLALRDLEAVEQRPNEYEVDMDIWHVSVEDQCYVCLAGSVMAMTFHIRQAKSIYDVCDFSGGIEVQNKLRALDCFRMGKVRDGLAAIKVGMGKESHWYPVLDRMVQLCPITTVTVCKYELDRDQFMRDMYRIVYSLENLYRDARKELTNGQ